MNLNKIQTLEAHRDESLTINLVSGARSIGHGDGES